MNPLKLFFSWPILLWILLRSKVMTKKIKKNPNYKDEKSTYIWTQKKAKFFAWLFNVEIKEINKENWPKHKKCVLVVNHQSNFDAVILLIANDFKNFAPLAFIAKKELENHSIFKNFIYLIDVLLLDRSKMQQAIEVLKKAEKLIKTPRTIVLFPEGTRSKSENINKFKPGLFKLPQNAFVKTIPVTIIGSHKILIKKISLKKKIVKIIFHKPIKPETSILLSTTKLCEHVEKIITNGIKENIK
jgi:1-acyl-sn-glycerol-3-phosphate acyltransferase